MKHLVIGVLASVCVLGLSLAGASSAPDLSVPQLVEKVGPCIYRVEVQGTALKSVADGANKKEVEEEFASVGTGFTVPFLHVLAGGSPLLLEALMPKKAAGGELSRMGKIHTVGYLATNSHVVCPDGMSLKSPPSIRLENDIYRLKGELVGHDAASDLAVIRVTVNDVQLFDSILSDRTLLPPQFERTGLLKTLHFADASQFKTGEDVVAIGFPRNLEGSPTVTRGILSALDRSYAQGQFSGLVQTDAGINKGNSGGPLLNRRGEVVGVNTYGYPNVLEFQFDARALRKLLDEDHDGEFKLNDTIVVRKGPVLAFAQQLDVTQGMNFARSGATARPFVEQLIDSGKVKRPALGIVPVTVDKEIAANLEMEVGVIIAAIKADSPAARAGLRPGDVITHLAKYRIRNVGDFNNALPLLPALLRRDEPARVQYLRPSDVVIKAIQKGKLSLESRDDLAKAISEKKFEETSVQLPK